MNGDEPRGMAHRLLDRDDQLVGLSVLGYVEDLVTVSPEQTYRKDNSAWRSL
jgi:hypothetical protein